MSQRAPGYLFQYQVPPTSSAVSSTRVENPRPRRRCSRYSPAMPAPTTTTSTSAFGWPTADPLPDDDMASPFVPDVRMPHDPGAIFAERPRRASGGRCQRFDGSRLVIMP